MLNNNTKEKLRDLLNDKAKTSSFAIIEKLQEMINRDNKSYEEIGEGIIRALLDDSADDLLIAICGWSAESILRFVKGDE